MMLMGRWMVEHTELKGCRAGCIAYACIRRLLLLRLVLLLLLSVHPRGYFTHLGILLPKRMDCS